MTKEKHRSRIGILSPNFGKKWSSETKRKMIISHTGKHSGENSNFWKGGKTSIGLLIRTSTKYNEWRLKIYQRDIFTCQECKESGVKLNADHIKRFSDILSDFLKIHSERDTQKLLIFSYNYAPFWDIKNGRTLCVECHRKTLTYGLQKITSLSL